MMKIDKTAIKEGIKRFFFPHDGSPRWMIILPYITLGILTILLLFGAASVWEYTNSSPFCGEACHTMPPEYSAYEASPHASVSCTKCHIGQEAFLVQLWYKSGELRHVVNINIGNYEYPIFTSSLPTTDKTCQRCHTSTKYSATTLLEKRQYADDETNSLTSIYLALKTGGGNEDGSIGPSIHWHATGNVQFLSRDKLQQEIPYVRVTTQDGQMTEFYDLDAGLTPDDIAGQELTQMDCVTCHNRVSHLIQSPDENVNRAMKFGEIANDLPNIHAQAVRLLSDEYADKETGIEAMTALETYYRQNYPTLYTERQADVQQAVATLERLYADNNFPEQELNWKTHPNNIGHQDFAGCFRCHDGKHIAQSGQLIPFACDTCHSIPTVVSRSDSTGVSLLLDSGPRPPTHTGDLWPVLHGKAIDASCATCHPPLDAETDYTQLDGQKPPADASFCGNAACHQSAWEYAGWDSENLQPLIEEQLDILLNTSPYLIYGVPRTYTDTFKAIFDGRCIFCHGSEEQKAGLDLSSYAAIMTGGNDGEVIIPGDVADSLLVQKQSAPAPHFGQLLPDELEALIAWIEAGAPE